MSNTYTSPNMNLVISNVLVNPGPDWAQSINASLTILDAHTHSSGSGVQITPQGLNINANLAFNINNAISLRSARFSPSASPLALVTDLDCVYVAGVDLYYNDGNGNQIRITQSGSLSGAAGTITGLPSGTASAAYAAGTFTFQSATLTSANIDAGSYILRNNTASSFGLTLQPPTLGANYSLTLPGLPGQTNVMTLSATGTISSVTFDQVGSTMTSVGANAIAASMSITGTNSIISTMSTNGADAIAGNFSATGTGSIVTTMTQAQKNQILSQSFNANLGGTAAQLNGGNIVTSTANATNGLGVIRGIVNPNGTVGGGEGFTSSVGGQSSFTITFANAFQDIPSIVVTPIDVNITCVAIVSSSPSPPSTTSCVITTAKNGSLQNVKFSFIAIGQRTP